MRLYRFAIGVIAFAAAQLGLFAAQQPFAPVPDDPGWFLNSGSGVGVVFIVMLLAAAISTAVRRDDLLAAAVHVTTGGAVAMVACYAWVGFGNIFPVVIAIGTGVIGVAAFAGSWIGLTVRGQPGT